MKVSAAVNEQFVHEFKRGFVKAIVGRTFRAYESVREEGFCNKVSKYQESFLFSFFFLENTIKYNV